MESIIQQKAEKRLLAHKWKSESLLAVLLMVIIGLFCLPKTPQAQGVSTVTYDEFYWLRVIPDFHLANNWRVTAEFEARRFAFENRQHQYLVPRITISKSFSKKASVGAGYTHFLQAVPQASDQDIDLIRPELRPHFDINLANLFNIAKLTHRYRIEPRFIRNTTGNELASGYDFRLRFRYRLGWNVPLNDQNSDLPLTGRIENEVMIQAGKNQGGNLFDQNRLSAGLSLGITEKTTLGADAIYWYQRLDDGTQVRNRYILRLTLTRDINL